MAFELPPLPYDYSALEPYIDTETMHLHHDKHHAAYVDKLNAALKDHAFANLSINELVRRQQRANGCTGTSHHCQVWFIRSVQDRIQ
jgi:superoxide dismutase